jgi:cytochrome c-type biogenesis protein CcmE
LFLKPKVPTGKQTRFFSVGRAPFKIRTISVEGRNRMSTAVKLGIAACIVTCVTAYMAYLGTTTSWKYYLTVDECLADAPELMKHRMRVNGKIVVGSLNIATSRQQATFKMCGTGRELPVSCVGPLPDNLAEDMDVVVEGRLDESGHLLGDKVLTKCASKYAPEARTAAASPQSSAEGRLR